MTTVYPDMKVLPVAEQLLECLCAANALNPKPAGLCGFRPYIDGSPLLGTNVDECCHGLAFVYTGGGAYPSRDSFPAPDAGPITCGVTWAVEMEMGIWRCAPIGTLQAPPEQDAWKVLNMDLLNDFATLRDALCCFLKKRPNKTVTVDNSGIINAGPEGGCVGWSMTLRVQV